MITKNLKMELRKKKLHLCAQYLELFKKLIETNYLIFIKTVYSFLL